MSARKAVAVVCLCLGVLTPASAQFSPTNIPGCTAWLDAGSLSGLSNGDPVTSWSDSSGNGWTVTQADTGRQPVYAASGIGGLPSVTFAAGDELRRGVSGLRVREVFGIINLTDNGGTWHYVFAGGHDAYSVRVQGGATTYQASGNRNYLFVTSNGRIWVNGVQTASFGATNTPHVVNAIDPALAIFADLRIGNGMNDYSRTWRGEIAELIFYDRMLTWHERNAVGRYLALKYSLATSHMVPPETHAELNHWAFDETEGGTATNSTSMTNLNGVAMTATAVGEGVNLDAAGMFGSAVSLSGAAGNHLTIPYLDGIHYGDYTMAAWIKPNDTGRNTILADWRSVHGFRFYSETGFSLDHRYKSGGPNTYQFINQDTLYTGKWHHVAVTWSRMTKTGTIYVNGRLVNSVISSQSGDSLDMYNSNRDYHIGWKQDSSDTFNGSIDELRVFAQALEGDTVRGLMYRNSPDPLILTTFEANDSVPSVSATDLINIGSPHYAGTPSFAAEAGGVESILRNGAADNGTDANTRATMGDGEGITYELNVAWNPKGYIITNITTYAQWPDAASGGRSQQRYKVSVAFVSAPTNFVELLPSTWWTRAATGGKYTTVVHASPDGGALSNATVVASGVQRIRFEMAGNPGSHEYSGASDRNMYREIDIFGHEVEPRITVLIVR